MLMLVPLALSVLLPGPEPPADKQYPVSRNRLGWVSSKPFTPWLTYGIAAAAGPIAAYCTSQNRVYRGKSEAGAYNPFFYAAAGLSFGNFLLVGTMGWLERRAVAAERA